jgi:hypothetical protein
VSRGSGFYENAYWALKVMHDNSKNEKVKMIYAKKLVQLENLFTLQKAVNSYNEKTGNYPESLEKLVENGYIPEIPEDPMGKGYVWDGEKVTVGEE